MLEIKDKTERVQLADISLQGLSVGDAFGEQFFGYHDEVIPKIDSRILPDPPWKCTDDTVMGISIVKTLISRTRIDRDFLAKQFLVQYRKDPARGYGRGIHAMLGNYMYDSDWKTLSAAAFDGQGSCGNGSAMRVGPVGAYFWDNPEKAAAEARLSAQVTHMHSEGQEGAAAVALAASWVVQKTRRNEVPGLFEYVIRYLAAGTLKDEVEKAGNLPGTTTAYDAAGILGTGQNILAVDTVPFCLWIVERFYDDYAEALWNTVAGLGDRDTTCAIVGSIVSLYSLGKDIPAAWTAARENLGVFQYP